MIDHSLVRDESYAMAPYGSPQPGAAGYRPDGIVQTVAVTRADLPQSGSMAGYGGSNQSLRLSQGLQAANALSATTRKTVGGFGEKAKRILVTMVFTSEAEHSSSALIVQRAGRHGTRHA